ncbi:MULTISPECIES: cytochrome c biogenesis protein ResB [Prauserella salsuginis group]|uniref:Cytochrome c biogenesis protein ResB n=1 Tax=Prauserella salsuginis TaxID=387889 RepID=A0ABW6G202_9PSEU|nr:MULTISPECIES: cytochrome c biogenesis protein ResB [Prauserella salsuginis group]MCR3719998.1 cytochrome c biogenesis protein [Prauserella flava]MCR3736458.1 cytochrome c biogenesis protein [Prauserella salsuginis]
MTPAPPQRTDKADDPTPSYRATPLRKAWAFVRNTWRGLTSMRTALILLFLLAVAALPGALLPQRSVNERNVNGYLAEHGWWGSLLDGLQMFDVYSSVWFSAIYLLLMVSIIGCLVPRTSDYIRSMRSKPVLTPRNLRRLPHHDRAETTDDVDAVMAAARKRLRGWRLTEREEAGGARSISAERGYLRETGNLLFHFGMLGVIISFAGGALYSYEGQVIVLADGSEFCNAGIYNFDSFEPGLQVDGTQLNPFCVRVNDFHAEFERGQPVAYNAGIDFQSGDDLAEGDWQPYDLAVNEPLRTAGDRLYLLGHGYAPTFTVTFPDGQSRTQTIQWRPVDETTLLSEGATKFEEPGITDPAERRERQLAVTGLFAPTPSMHGKILSSAGPQLTDPTVAVDIMRGDLGVDSGRGQSIFEVDQSMVDAGRLERVARENLEVGQSLALDDGTTVRFDGVERFVSLQVSHDPLQNWVLASAVVMFAGLGASLFIKRRRLWVRATPVGGDDDPAGTQARGVPADDTAVADTAGDTAVEDAAGDTATGTEADDAAAGGTGTNERRTVVEVGGLARTDQAGYGEEFTRIAAELLGRK